MDKKQAEGVWRYIPVPPDPPEFSFSYRKTKDDPTLFTTGSWISEWDGTFSGKSKDIGFAILHDAGPAIFVDSLSFGSVSVDGRSGGLELFLLGRGLVGDWEGTWQITGATGELEGLQGQGEWSGAGWSGDPEVMGEVNYSGSIYFGRD